MSSIHQQGMFNWQACQSIQVSMSFIEALKGSCPCFLHSGRSSTPWGMCVFLPLGVLRVWLHLQFPKGYPPLLLRPTRGPWSSVQRMTSWATPTVATGVGSLYISHPPAQSFNVTFKHLSSSSALWQAVLASWRAFSCGSPLLLGLGQGSSTGPHVSSLAAMGYTP